MISNHQDDLEEYKKRGKCPECVGRGRLATGAGDSDRCYSCRGEGSWQAYLLHREYCRGWNAAIDQLQRTKRDMP